jgi:metal-responsive CopG/Arc/MetJ family transcriptional regulator
MGSKMVRAHVILPEDLVEAVDQLVGQRRRSEFVADALREKVRKERQTLALQKSAGILDLADYPQWSTPEKVSAWVRAQRTGCSHDSQRDES